VQITMIRLLARRLEGPLSHKPNADALACQGLTPIDRGDFSVFDFQCGLLELPIGFQRDEPDNPLTKPARTNSVPWNKAAKRSNSRPLLFFKERKFPASCYASRFHVQIHQI
jgi:hypothetical protein